MVVEDKFEETTHTKRLVTPRLEHFVHNGERLVLISHKTVTSPSLDGQVKQKIYI